MRKKKYYREPCNVNGNVSFALTCVNASSKNFEKYCLIRMSIIFQVFSKDLIKGSRFKTNDI